MPPKPVSSSRTTMLATKAVVTNMEIRAKNRWTPAIAVAAFL
jgi:hypothetical protein